MAKFFKILLTAVIVLLLVAVVGGYIFINTFDFNKYKGYVTELASKELGRKLQLTAMPAWGFRWCRPLCSKMWSWPTRHGLRHRRW